MDAAVAEWDSLEGGPRPSMTKFAVKRGIPQKTFWRYACDVKSKRLKVGDRRGVKPLLSKDQQQVVVDCIRRYDRANRGLGRDEILERICVLKPNLKQKQVSTMDFCAHAWPVRHWF